jgi:hypothetical protein
MVGVHDVVAVESRACFVIGDGHRDTFWDAGTNHVPNCRPADAGKELLADSRLPACLPLGTADVLDLLPVLMEDIRTAQPAASELGVEVRAYIFTALARSSSIHCSVPVAFGGLLRLTLSINPFVSSMTAFSPGVKQSLLAALHNTPLKRTCPSRFSHVLTSTSFPIIFSTPTSGFFFRWVTYQSKGRSTCSTNSKTRTAIPMIIRVFFITDIPDLNSKFVFAPFHACLRTKTRFQIKG